MECFAIDQKKNIVFFSRVNHGLFNRSFHSVFFVCVEAIHSFYDHFNCFSRRFYGKIELLLIENKSCHWAGMIRGWNEEEL